MHCIVCREGRDLSCSLKQIIASNITETMMRLCTIFYITFTSPVSPAPQKIYLALGPLCLNISTLMLADRITRKFLSVEHDVRSYWWGDCLSSTAQLISNTNTYNMLDSLNNVVVSSQQVSKVTHRF